MLKEPRLTLDVKFCTFPHPPRPFRLKSTHLRGGHGSEQDHRVVDLHATQASGGEGSQKIKEVKESLVKDQADYIKSKEVG